MFSSGDTVAFHGHKSGRFRNQCIPPFAGSGKPFFVCHSVIVLKLLDITVQIFLSLFLFSPCRQRPSVR
jgi:hypothetical protein